MDQNKNKQTYDLEVRTYNFALNCRNFIKLLEINTINNEYQRQLTRSSGSVAANYIEANESLSKRDFIHRIKLSLKETKESRLWLKLCYVWPYMEKQRLELINEASELTKIFSAIIEKSK
jgi:four helix bundle protein